MKNSPTLLHTFSGVTDPPVFSLSLRRCPFSQHLFASENRDDIIRSAIEHAGNFIGITLRLRKEALTFDDFVTDRLGKYSSDDSITSLAEFVVQKITPRHPVRAASPCSPRCAVREGFSTRGPGTHQDSRNRLLGLLETRAAVSFDSFHFIDGHHHVI